MGERSDQARAIGRRITKEMRSTGIGVRKLQERVRNHRSAMGRDLDGTSYGTIRAYAKGDVFKPRQGILDSIAHVLGVRPVWLSTEEGYRTEKEQNRATERYPELRQVGDTVWVDLETYDRIYQNLTLPDTPLPVRSMFWETIDGLNRPPDVNDNEELYRLAEWIEQWIHEPIAKYYVGVPVRPAPVPQVVSYYVAALNALALLFSIGRTSNVPRFDP